MLKKFFAAAAAVVLSANVALADTRKDFQVFKDVANSVNRYAWFTIFDDVSANVHGGVVTLTGKVTMPYKRDDIAKRIARLDGVARVDNRITVLPVSTFDNQLRNRIARSIYGNPNFWSYGATANPSIHIIVEHGHVTLSGVVNSEVDRMLARSLATQPGAFSVTNNLKTTAEMRDAVERS